jgi:hypothetical protein
MSGGRIIASYKRLHTKALVKNKKEKRRKWEKLFICILYKNSLGISVLNFKIGRLFWTYWESGANERRLR